MRFEAVSKRFGNIVAVERLSLDGVVSETYGPGEAGYVQQLKDYDNAFAQERSSTATGFSL